MNNPKKYLDKRLDIGFGSVQSLKIVKISSENYRVTASLIRSDNQSFVLESVLIRLTAKKMFSTYFETHKPASFTSYWIENPIGPPDCPIALISRESCFEKMYGLLQIDTFTYYIFCRSRKFWENTKNCRNFGFLSSLADESETDSPTFVDAPVSITNEDNVLCLLHSVVLFPRILLGISWHV